MKPRHPCVLGALLALGMPLAAAPGSDAPVATAYPVAAAHPSADTVPAAPGTRAWLQLQRSGEAASAQSQPLSGQVMEKVYARYLKSFEHPVPEELDPRRDTR